MYRLSTRRLLAAHPSGGRRLLARHNPHEKAARTFVTSRRALPNASLLYKPPHQSTTRSLASSSTAYSSLEYPLATEPPEITHTVAHAIRGQEPTHTAAAPPPQSSPTATQVQTLQQRPMSPGVSSIAPQVPAHIPPNVPAEELATPETLVTALENGIRVVSMETYGQVSTVGTVSNVGSQWEGRHQSHVTHLLEAMAFGTTKHRSGLQVAQSLQDWGGSNFANSGREQSLHCIDVLRPNVDQAVGLLAETLLEPAFDPLELQEAHLALEYQAMNVPPELWLAEALQMAAYGPTQPLGQAHFLPSHGSAAHLTPAVVRAFWEAHFVQNPHEIVVAGAGIGHAALVEMAEQHFGHLQQQQASPRTLPPSHYQGGQANMVHPVEDGFIRIGLVWPSGGWFGDDLVATCVLQTLLGGGNSFSAGGPGKGMYSRLYRQVLNRYAWAESAEALTAFYNDSGLWGVTGSTIPRKAADLVKVLAEHVARIAVTPVTDEELFRARNMLKNNVLTQLESRLVLFEDLGRQVLTYGKREDMWTTCQRIDAVTAEDLMRVARQSLTHPPSLAAVGDNLDDVPRQEEVARWFN